MSFSNWLGSLSVPTVIIMVGISFLMQAWAIGIQFLLVKEYRGIRIIALAHLVLALAFFLLPFRERLHPVISIVLANTLINLGLGLAYVALRRFVGRKSNPILPVTVVAGGGLLLAFFTFVEPNVAARVLVMSVTSIPLMLANLKTLIARETRTYRLGAIIIGVTFFLYAAFQLVRGVGALVSPPESIFDPSLPQVLYFGGLFISGYFWSAGFILMVSQRLQHELNELATMDMLTRLHNRREMTRLLEAEFGRKNRGLSEFSILLADIDHFKKVNDSHGHLVGDFILAMIARYLANAIRTQDVVARWGGEEFLVLLPGTSYEDALLVARRICSAIESHEFKQDGRVVRITLSIGVASSHDCRDIDEIFRSADAALYRAKTNRNMAA